MKLATKPLRHYPPHLSNVTTLPWKIQILILFTLLQINYSMFLIIYFFDQFVAPEIPRSRRYCSVC